jgi:hypothetical protein
VAQSNEKTSVENLQADTAPRDAGYDRDRTAMRSALFTSITAMALTAGVASFAIHQANRPVANAAPSVETYTALANLIAASGLQPAPAAQPAAQTPAPAVAAPQPVQPSFTAPQPTLRPTPTAAPPQGVQQEPVSRISAMLNQSSVAGPLMDKLAEAAAIRVPGELSAERPVIAFFDPRCPYCHKAYEALTGKVDILWLPTLALGSPESGEPLLAGLLGATEATMEGGEIAAVTLPDDPERAARLDAVMRGDDIERGDITEAQRFVANDNLALAVELYRYHNEPLGVPTFVVPRPDGTAAFVRGWDDRETLNEIVTEYQGQGSEG